MKLISSIALSLAIVFVAHANAETLNFAVQEDYLPFSSLDQSGKPVGIDVDIASEMGKRAGYEVEFSVLPWKRVLSNVERGESDGAMGAFKRPEREIFAQYMSNPTRYAVFGAFSPQKKPYDYSGLDSLKGKKLEALIGFAVTPEIDAAVEAGELDVSRVRSVETAVKKIAAARVDVYMGNAYVTRYVASQLGVRDKIHESSTTLNEGEAVFSILSRAKLGTNLDTVTAKLNDALASMIDDGTVQKIIDKNTQ